jgi:hypothetical protein
LLLKDGCRRALIIGTLEIRLRFWVLPELRSRATTRIKSKLPWVLSEAVDKEHKGILRKHPTMY